MEIDSIIRQNLLSKDQPKSSALGKDDFLNLMVLQMKNQDPLDPMDNQAMLSQMAQFSSLEQMSNLNQTMTDGNAQNSFMQTAALLGKEVAVLDPTVPASEAETIVSKVTAVGYAEDGPVITLENGYSTGLTNLLGVRNPVE